MALLAWNTAGKLDRHFEQGWGCAWLGLALTTRDHRSVCYRTPWSGLLLIKPRGGAGPMVPFLYHVRPVAACAIYFIVSNFTEIDICCPLLITFTPSSQKKCFFNQDATESFTILVIALRMDGRTDEHMLT